MPASEIEKTIETALRHHEAGRLRHAAALYRRALKQDPGNATVLHLLGVLAHQVDRRDDALLLLRRAAAARPSDPSFHEDLGNLYFRRGQFDEAIACYQEAIRLENRAAAHAQLGAALARQGRLPEAVEAYRRAVEASGLLNTARLVRVNPEEPADLLAAASRASVGLEIDTPSLESMSSYEARATAAGGPIPQEHRLGLDPMPQVIPDPIAWPVTEPQPALSHVERPVVSAVEYPAMLEGVVVVPANGFAVDGAHVNGEVSAIPGLAITVSTPLSDEVPSTALMPAGATLAPVEVPASAGAHITAEAIVSVGVEIETRQILSVAQPMPAAPVVAAPVKSDGGPVGPDPASAGLLLDPESVATDESTDPFLLSLDDALISLSGFGDSEPDPLPAWPPSESPLPVAALNGEMEAPIAVGLLEAEANRPTDAEPEPVALGRAELDRLGLTASAGVFAELPQLPSSLAPADVHADYSGVVTFDPPPDSATSTIDAPTQTELEQKAERVDEPADEAEDLAGFTEEEVGAPAGESSSANDPPPDAKDDGSIEGDYVRHRKLRRARARRKRKPSEAAVLRRQGDALLRQRKLDEAIAIYTRVVALMPTSAKSHRDLAAAYLRDDRLEEAVTSLNRALELRPRFAEAYASLGDAYHLQGKLDLAIGCYRKVLALRPDAARAHSNLLLTLNYHHKFDPKTVFQEHVRWAELHGRPAGEAIAPHGNDCDPARRLRIGYVSPDFRRHSVNYFIEPVLARHDRKNFALYCYSDAMRPDEVTDRIAGYCDGWRDIRGMRDIEVCQLVRDDAIDVLIDLCGHTGSNRMAVFARKPAPVQATYLGYPNTTGLSTVDYRITDGWADPPGLTEHLYTEKLVRLPANFLCYSPSPEAPETGRPPCLDTKRVTFGCFNILAKVTPEVMALWARIVAAVPGSRLLMKDRVGSFAYAGRRQYVRDIFRYHGVDPDRLELLPKDHDYAQHLQAYSRIDVMLDPFPYNGTTTTCEALWMGVPVITLGGATHVSRVGVSLLANLDLRQFIAASGADYVRKAVALASDADQLLFLRETLRDRMRRSPLTGAERFTRQLEAAYRQMWQTWCGGRDPSAAKPEDTGTILALRDDE